MKLLKLLLTAIMVAVVCVPEALAEEKTLEQEAIYLDPAKIKGGFQEGNGIAMEGEIYFADYYSMGGAKCAAFLMSKNGDLFCVLENTPAEDLREELSGTRSKVQITGDATQDKDGKYLVIQEYSVGETIKIYSLPSYLRRSA